MKKKILIAIAVLVGLLVLTIGLVVAVKLLSLHTGSNDLQLAEQTVSSFLTDYKNCKGSSAKYLSNNYDNRESVFSDVQRAFAKNLKFKILGTEKKGNKFIVKAEIENVDVVAVFERIKDKDKGNQEEFEKLLVTEIKKSNVEKKKFICDVYVVSVGTEYKIDLTGEVSNALYGGYNEFWSSELWSSVHEEIDQQGNPTIDMDKSVWELYDENEKRRNGQ